jgi:hypothetical protein
VRARGRTAIHYVAPGVASAGFTGVGRARQDATLRLRAARAPAFAPPCHLVPGVLREDDLHCRPVEETVADTWAWLQAEGDPPLRPGRPANGLDPERERQALDLAASPGSSA